MRYRMTMALLGLLAGAALAQERSPGQPRNREEMRERRGRMSSDAKALKVGQLAPAIKLTSLDGEKSFDLAANIDKRPVILFFGSYT